MQSRMNWWGAHRRRVSSQRRRPRTLCDRPTDRPLPRAVLPDPRSEHYFLRGWHSHLVFCIFSSERLVEHGPRHLKAGMGRAEVK